MFYIIFIPSTCPDNTLILQTSPIMDETKKDNAMAIKDILTSGASVSITVSADDLRVFFAEVAQQVINQEKAAEAARNADGVMSQTDVCKFLGVSKSTLWRWERDNYLLPTGRMGRSPQYLKSDVERIKKGA